jgi:hypothetical protein
MRKYYASTPHPEWILLPYDHELDKIMIAIPLFGRLLPQGSNDAA